MTRYREIARVVAERVRAGELVAGAELPGVRDGAARWGTTPSTVGRAYRLLAEAGVIARSDRRRARVAVGAVVAAARLVEPDRVFRLVGSDDPALRVLLAGAGPSVVTVSTSGSFAGLRALSRGEADGAAIHLRHRDGVYNGPFARGLLGERDPVLLHLWWREQGLVVPAGNPRGVVSVGDLDGLLVARREPGAGTRVLLDQLLIAAGLRPERVSGPELCSHLEIALAVAAGIADVALGVRAGVAELGLAFVPVTWESYDIALGRSALGAARPLIEALHSAGVRAAIERLGGYDLSTSGTVHTPS